VQPTTPKEFGNTRLCKTGSCQVATRPIESGTLHGPDFVPFFTKCDHHADCGRSSRQVSPGRDSRFCELLEKSPARRSTGFDERGAGGNTRSYASARLLAPASAQAIVRVQNGETHDRFAATAPDWLVAATVLRRVSCSVRTAIADRFDLLLRR